MWTGACSGTGHRTYGVMGNETNIATRLMQRATPGQILVTSQVVDPAKLIYFYQSLEAIQVKGRSKPLPVWQVLGRQQQASSEWTLFVQPVVGRRNEFALLNAALVDVQAGQGQVVRLAGEAGRCGEKPPGRTVQPVCASCWPWGAAGHRHVPKALPTPRRITPGARFSARSWSWSILPNTRPWPA